MTLSVSDQGLRRVSVHAGTAVADLALPCGMPVAALLPPIVDILKAHGVSDLTGVSYQLSIPGAAALDSSMTLVQNGIRDGDVLVVSRSAAPPPDFRHDDVAQAVSQTLNERTSSPSQIRRVMRLSASLAAGYLAGIGSLALIRNTFIAGAEGHRGATAGIAVSVAFAAAMMSALAQRAYRDAMAGLTLGLTSTAFAATAGFLAVPGAPGLPNVLLAASSAAVTATLTMRVSGCGEITLTAVSCFAAVVAVAAFGGVLTGVPPYVIGAVSAVVSLGLLGVAAPAAVVLAGLSPKSNCDNAVEDLTAKALRADAWLSILLAAFSSSGAVGAIVTVSVGIPRSGCSTFSAATGVLLLLRANAVDRKGTLVCFIGAVMTIGTTVGFAAIRAPEHGPWIAAATTLLVATAVYLGFVTPGISFSPIARKSAELLECLVLIAMVPLTFWICGFYDTARGLHPTWS
ncbi:type VII secretion integral membrane protein EccD [Mycobacterium montefiorense]|uniref:type VII secretion integral membrane protein EccD n=1 Tax=Mycobacterium montefiorense TaxID=154654 RepID=UPI0021F35618|nr:type VII secretion integral membrane protein EccD [Mycobacterium montefiorense]